jgi:hypothetical protein
VAAAGWAAAVATEVVVKAAAAAAEEEVMEVAAKEVAEVEGETAAGAGCAHRPSVTTTRVSVEGSDSATGQGDVCTDYTL